MSKTLRSETPLLTEEEIILQILEKMLDTHEKKGLGMCERTLAILTGQVEMHRDLGKLVPTHIIIDIRNKQLQVNKIYAKCGLPPKYEVPDISLSEKQQRLDSHQQNMLRIQLIKLKHLQEEYERLREAGADTTIAQLSIIDTQNEIDKLDAMIK